MVSDPNTGIDLSRFPIHLGIGTVAVVQPEFTGSADWFGDYINRTVEDGKEGRLVVIQNFSESWKHWEVHPQGYEVVVCISGNVDVIQEIDGKHVRTTLKASEYVINLPGVWHTTDVAEPCSVLSIAAGIGTQYRPREPAMAT